MEQKRTLKAASKYGPREKMTTEITVKFRLPTKDFSADERGQRA